MVCVGLGSLLCHADRGSWPAPAVPLRSWSSLSLYGARPFLQHAGDFL